MNLKKCFRYTFLGALLCFPACGGGGSGCSVTFGTPPCTSSLPAGTNGACCRSATHGSGRCDSGLVCNRNTCEPCGGDGQRCCASNTCNSGLSCETDINRCDDCGEVGEECCASSVWRDGIGYHTCHGSAACNIGTDRCEGEAPPPGMCEGTVEVVFNCDVGHGCVEPCTGHGTSVASARECVEFLGFDVVTAPVEYFNFCADGPLLENDTVQFLARNRDDAFMCAQHVRSDYTNWRDGCCPDGDVCLGE